VTTSELGALLNEPVPPVSVEDAEALARAYFGVEAAAEPLGGERDRNFHLRETGGEEWVLKIVHPAEDPELTDLQSQALMHLASRDPGLPVPRVRLPLRGYRADVLWQRGTGPGSVASRIRMYSFLPGAPMHLTASTSVLRRNLGGTLARMDLALQDLRHPAESHDLAWDAQNVARVGHLLGDSDGDDLARQALDHFVDHAAPGLARLRTQIIHNDFNPHNILTQEVGDPRIAGIIDFGDLIRGPLVQDLATAAAYQIADGGHPLVGPAEVVGAFHDVCPLLAHEVEVLFDLIVARLILIITITGWRARNHPENRDYILRNSQRARAGLRRLASMECRDACAYFHHILES